MIVTQERDKLNVIHGKSLLSERLHIKTVEVRIYTTLNKLVFILIMKNCDQLINN